MSCDAGTNRELKDNSCSCGEGFYDDGVNKTCQRKTQKIFLKRKNLKKNFFSIIFTACHPTC